MQFSEWTSSFRRHADENLTLRFYSGDALSFCHILQQNASGTDDVDADRYRDYNKLTPLILDGEDYKRRVAPLAFDIIDNSNLVDHLGMLNVLASATPLMKATVSSTLYVEVLVLRDKSHKNLMDRILCGNFPTISRLLGVFPVDYWLNTTAILTVDQGLYDMLGGSGKDDMVRQTQSRVVWKRSAPIDRDQPMPKLHFQENDLAHFLHNIYQVHSHLSKSLSTNHGFSLKVGYTSMRTICKVSPSSTLHEDFRSQSSRKFGCF
jgi:hypothetical protein